MNIFNSLALKQGHKGQTRRMKGAHKKPQTEREMEGREETEEMEGQNGDKRRSEKVVKGFAFAYDKCK